jgi:hypothetical protein
MAEEIDRKYLPEFVQTTFVISLGACYKSFEMMKTPQDSVTKMLGEMKEMFKIPADAGEGLQKKAEAVAGVWMSKGMDLMEICKTAGEKFTEAK